MKKLISILFLVTGAAALYAQTLSWDIRFLKGRARESVPINRMVRMAAGEDFVISIRPVSDCYCYVVSYDSDRDIAVLFNQPMKGGAETFLGPYEPDAQLTETVYVIMVLEKQPRLESLIAAFENNPHSRQNIDNLYREVVGLQNKAAELGEVPGAFINSGGSSRGGGSEEYATRFTDKNLYVRTITIR